MSQTLFEVEWCTELPTDENGDRDIDNATMCVKHFTTLDAARAWAKRVAPVDEFGSVRITPFVRVPYEPGFPGTYLEYSETLEYVEPE